MSAGQHNIIVTQGATFKLPLTIRTDGVAWNLTSYTARMQVRRSSIDANTLLSLVSPTDITLNSTGKIVVNASATATAAMPLGRWVYELELISAGGEVTPILAGRFVVKEGVAK